MAEYHIRASTWYEQNGLELEAFHHAAAAHDIERAERLIEGKGMPGKGMPGIGMPGIGMPLHFRGAVAPVLAWLASLPQADLDANPSLWTTYASVLLVSGQQTAAEQKLQAGSLIAGGMVANAGIAPVVALYAKDPAQAALTWQGIETVANGLGNGNGEILGGLLALLVSLAALRAGGLPKGLNILGLLVGAVGIISIVPGLTDMMVGIFGLSQIIWFVWLGMVLLRSEASRAEAGAWAAA